MDVLSKLGYEFSTLPDSTISVPLKRPVQFRSHELQEDLLLVLLPCRFPDTGFSWDRFATFNQLEMHTMTPRTTTMKFDFKRSSFFIDFHRLGLPKCPQLDRKQSLWPWQMMSTDARYVTWCFKTVSERLRKGISDPQVS